MCYVVLDTLSIAELNNKFLWEGSHPFRCRTEVQKQHCAQDLAPNLHMMSKAVTKIGVATVTNK